VVIKRDKWGIPHIFGETDNATAFGLAYAHAEDDFPLIQGSLVAARGKLAQLKLAKISIINDYLVQLLDIPAHTDRQHQAMPGKGLPSRARVAGTLSPLFALLQILVRKPGPWSGRTGIERPKSKLYI
jgi:hypothetical protein